MILMGSALGGGQYVALVFDSASTQEDFPVVLAGCVSKGGWDDMAIYLSKGAIELWKAQVITNTQAKCPIISIDCNP